jgi:sulfonate transport system substrate-binding protein
MKISPRMTRLKLALAITALPLLVAACGSSSTSAGSATGDDGSTPLPRVATIDGYPYIPVAQKAGIFSKTFGQDGSGISVSPVDSANDAIAALRTGKVDIAVVGYDPAGLVGVDNVQAIAATEVSPNTTRLLVSSKSSISSIADLKGKKVGSYTTTPNVALVMALHSAGLTPSDIDYVDLDNDVAASTLAGGGIDAWMTYDPQAAISETKGLAKSIATGKDFDYLNPIVMYTTTSYLADHQASVEAMLKTYSQAIDWINANKDETASLVAQATGVDDASEKLAISHRDYKLTPISGDVLTFMKQAATIDQQLGAITAVPDWDKIANTSVYDEVTKAQ